MNSIILVGAGGFLGASARYLLGKYINNNWKGSFPLGTLVINTLGSFVLGLVVFHPLLFASLRQEVNLGIGIGFLGSFTTFSTFEYETLELLEKGKKATAGIYVLSSFIIGITCAWVTKWL